ncbi:MAG: hypothetical protein ACPGXL_05405 [Chitinophagales bacterium]
MNTTTLLYATLVWCVIAQNTALVAQPSKTNRTSLQTIDAYLGTLGFASQAKKMERILQTELQKHINIHENHKCQQELLDLYERFLSQGLFQERIETFYSEEIPLDSLSLLLSHLENPLLQKMLALEKESDDNFFEDKFMQYLIDNQHVIQQESERMDYVDSLVWMLGVGEATHAFIYRTNALVGIASEALLPIRKRQKAAENLSFYELMSYPKQQDLQHKLLVYASFYQYKEESLEDLIAYLAFWQSVEGQYILKTHQQAIDYAWKQLFIQLRQSFN